MMIRPCKNNYCTRRVITRNTLSLCHKCAEVANTIRYLIEMGIVGSAPNAASRLKDLGLELPK